MAKSYPVPNNFIANAHITADRYKQLYSESISQPDIFWEKQANEFLDWIKPWDEIHSSNLPAGKVQWFSGATLNASVNCIDRHLPEKSNQVAIIWEGASQDEHAKIN